MIFRAAHYAILSASARCGACRYWTHVVAIAVPAGHEVLAGGEWEREAFAATLFYIESIPASARERLELVAPWYRPASAVEGNERGSRELAGRCWRNHCEHCDAALDDHDLHCEPDGIFAGVVGARDPGSAAQFIRWELREPLKVVAGGCGEDPSV